ncbi:MAG: hypothetical protein AABO57_12595, partial [Acidobacteriota bacterium]
MDIEGTIQFILDQQAQFSSDMARIDSTLERTGEFLATLAQRQITTEETTRGLANSQERTGEFLATLAQRQITTE